MNKGKHSSIKKHFNMSTTRVVFKIIIVLIFILVGYLIYDILSLETKPTTNTDTQINEPTEKVEIKTTLTVNGAEHLEVTGVYINSDNPELSTVAARLKNHSDQSYENVNIRINLFDTDNNEITFLDYKIDKIEAHGQASTFAALEMDLSNCVNYSLTLIN